MSAIDDFLGGNRYSVKTQGVYRYYLERLGDELEELDSGRFLAWLNEWPDSSRYIACCAVRSFLRWRCGGSHPALLVRVKRAAVGPQRTLDDQQVQKLLAVFDTSTKRGVRDLAICTLALDTGFRAAELCRLRVDKVNLSERTAWVVVKGGEWAPGGFVAYTAACLAAWLPVRAVLVQPGVKALFVGVQSSVGKQLTPGGLRCIFRRWGVLAGIGALSPHDLRRTFCTMALKSGAPTRIVQKAGRWSNISMVERYSKGLNVHDIDPYSPVNRIMGLGGESTR